MKKSEIGVLGLGVMGQSLALNLMNHGYQVSLYNQHANKMYQFIETRLNKQIYRACDTLKEFVDSLEAPRKIILMIPERAVDKVLRELVELLDLSDIIIDGGNSYYKDSIYRQKYCEERNIDFLGIGISGGEKGALTGPSMMPSGKYEVYMKVKDILERIAAKAEDSKPCVAYIGEAGSGHFVKMVHNGIEYADLQIICELYDIMRYGYGMDCDEIASQFEKWNQSRLRSYLLELTAKILRVKENEQPLIDYILDVASEKGTGKWSVLASMEYKVMIPSISAAVYARFMSNRKELRTKLDQMYLKAQLYPQYDEKMLEKAFYAARLLSYAQGFDLINRASDIHGWSLKSDEIALIWRNGCIIRSDLLNDIAQAYQNPVEHLLEDLKISEMLSENISSLRRLCQRAIGLQIPCSVLQISLQYFDGLIQARGSANLLQAQRDAFGSHTYGRIDQSGSFHTQWEE